MPGVAGAPVALAGQVLPGVEGLPVMVLVAGLVTLVLAVLAGMLMAVSLPGALAGMGLEALLLLPGLLPGEARMLRVAGDLSFGHRMGKILSCGSESSNRKDCR
jgi:hypothetical protein